LCLFSPLILWCIVTRSPIHLPFSCWYNNGLVWRGQRFRFQIYTWVSTTAFTVTVWPRTNCICSLSLCLLIFKMGWYL
jgi:hypothetical protein